jgi:hypothetical protein
MIKYIYALFLGILLATFIGVGISTFYPGPDRPDYNEPVASTTEASCLEQQTQQKEQNEQYQAYEDKLSVYNRNASLMNLAGALIALIIALGFASKLAIISDGLLLGGVFSLLYSTILGLSTGDAKFRFIVATVGLLVAIFLGYWKFLRAERATR